MLQSAADVCFIVEIFPTQELQGNEGPTSLVSQYVTSQMGQETTKTLPILAKLCLL